MPHEKQLIVTYQGSEVNLWDFYDENGNLLVEQGHVWDDNLDLSERNLSDNLDSISIVESEMPDLSFLHVTGDVDVSSNRCLTKLSMLPQKIDGNLFANHCGFKSVEGLSSIGKSLYLIGCPMEQKAYFIARTAAMGGGNAAILNGYPIEDEIVREDLNVKGKVFTPVAYARWLARSQKLLQYLSERAYTNGAKHQALAKHLLDWYPRYIAKNDPQSVHINKRFAKDKNEYNLRLEAKAKAAEKARIESIRRAEEKAKEEAASAINKAMSANHTQNTPGAKEWARRQVEGAVVPRRSIRKEKKKTETPAVTEGKNLIAKIKEVQKGTSVIRMTAEEVRNYMEGIRALKQRIDNYVRGQETDSFPTLGKLLELKKAYLFNAVNGESAKDLPPRLVTEAMDIIGYRGNGKRKEAKKERVKQEAVAACRFEAKRAKYVYVTPSAPTQQMPKRQAEFKLPRKAKKELVGYIRKLFCLAVVFNREQPHHVLSLTVNLLTILQNGNQRK